MSISPLRKPFAVILVASACLASLSARAQVNYPNAGGARSAGPGAMQQRRAGEAPGQPQPMAADAVQIRKLTGIGPQTVIKTPEYKTNIPKSSTRPKDWVQITLKFDTGAEWIGSMTVSYIVLALGEVDRERVYSLYRETLTHTDVERGRDHQSTVFLTPAAVKRYGMPVAVHVEISVDGKVVAAEDDVDPGVKLPPKWWEASEVLNRVQTRDGYLLAPKDTPFAFVNPDDYEVTR